MMDTIAAIPLTTDTQLVSKGWPKPFPFSFETINMPVVNYCF